MSRLPIANAFAQGGQTGLGILDLIQRQAYQEQRAQQEAEILAQRQQEQQFRQQQAMQQQAMQQQLQMQAAAENEAMLGLDMMDLSSIYGNQQGPPEPGASIVGPTPELQQLFRQLPARERRAMIERVQGERETREQEKQRRDRIDRYNRMIQTEQNPAIRSQLEYQRELLLMNEQIPAGLHTELARTMGDKPSAAPSLTPLQVANFRQAYAQSFIDEQAALANPNLAGNEEAMAQIRSGFQQLRQNIAESLPADQRPKEPEKQPPQIRLTPEESQTMQTDLLSTATLIAGQSPGQEQAILRAVSSLQTNQDFIRAYAANDTQTMIQLVRRVLTPQQPQPQARPSTYNAVQP